MTAPRELIVAAKVPPQRPGDHDRTVCRYCGASIEPIEALVDSEVWWRCPHCAALLERKVGGAR